MSEPMVTIPERLAKHVISTYEDFAACDFEMFDGSADDKFNALGSAVGELEHEIWKARAFADGSASKPKCACCGITFPSESK